MIWPDEYSSRHFRVTGTGINTGRKRQRVYDARDEQHLIQVAEADGTIIDSYVEIPPPPPSEGQLDYAKKLGIANLPENASYHDVYKLINNEIKRRLIEGGRKAGLSVSNEISYEEARDLEDLLWSTEHEGSTTWHHRSLPTEEEVQIGVSLGVPSVTRFVSASKLYERVWQYLSQSGDQSDIASWYIYNVYLDLLQGEYAEKLKPQDPPFKLLAGQFMKDEKAVNSLLRSSTYLRFRAIPGYGSGDVPHATRETIAYKTAQKLIADEMQIVRSTPSRPSASKSSVNTMRVNENTGCALAIVMLSLLPLSAGALIIGMVLISP